MHRENRTIQTGIGMFVLGAGVGAGLGLLLAPMSGRRTRRALRYKMEEGSEILQDKVRTMVEEGKEILQDKVRTVVEEGKEAINRGASNLSAAFGTNANARAES